MELFFMNTCNAHIILILSMCSKANRSLNFFLRHNLNKCTSDIMENAYFITTRMCSLSLGPLS